MVTLSEEPIAVNPEMAEGQMLAIISASGNLVDEQYARAAQILNAHPDLRVRTLRYLNRVNERTFIGPKQYLNEAERADTHLLLPDQLRIAHERYDKAAGQQIRLLRKCRYSEDEIRGFEEQTYIKLSFGGNNDTSFVIAGVSAMGLPEDRRVHFLARHLIERAVDITRFQRTAEQDVALIKQQLGDKYEEAIEDAVHTMIAVRSTPEYDSQILHKPGESAVGNAINRLQQIAPILNLSPEFVQSLTAVPSPPPTA